jgi:hypothetical protein
MTKEEVEAVLAHEVAHIANGDMADLIQGVVNTFVMFFARIVGYFVDSFLRRNNEENSGPGIAYMVTVFVCEIVFGILASIIVMYFSRQREYRADAGAAALMGSKVPMMNALRRLGGLQSDGLPQNLQASGISGRESGWACSPATRRWSRASPPCRLHADAMLADRTAPVRPASGGTCVAVMPAYSRACGLCDASFPRFAQARSRPPPVTVISDKFIHPERNPD